MRDATFNGKPIKINGEEIKEGYIAPDFEVIDNQFKPIRLNSFLGKPVVLISIPSVDTPVCTKQIIRFNQEATLLHNAIIIFVSVDLPFALEKFCGTYNIKNVILTSDYQNLVFGNKYGVIIKGMNIFCRALFVIDKNGVVRYSEYTKEVNSHPDYDRALEYIKEIS